MPSKQADLILVFLFIFFLGICLIIILNFSEKMKELEKLTQETTNSKFIHNQLEPLCKTLECEYEKLKKQSEINFKEFEKDKELINEHENSLNS